MRIFKIVLFLNTCILLFIQNNFSQPANLTFDKLGTKDGLSNSSVFCIYQDKRGFIWMGTENGLNRYDGYKFTIYTHNPQDPYSLSDDRITSIAEDNNGNLWFGTWDGGLNFYNCSQDRFYSFMHDPDNNSSISSNLVCTIFFDKTGQLWAGTFGGGLNLFDVKTKTFKRFTHIPKDSTSISDNFVSSIYEDSYGNLWVGTFYGGLNLLNRKNNTFKVLKHQPDNPNSLPGNKISAIFEDNAKNLWIGTDNNGISVLSPNRQTFTNYKAENKPGKLNTNRIRCFCQDENKTIWIGSDGKGINLYNPVQKNFTYISNDPANPKSLSSNVVFSLLKSKDGIVWAGTFRGGLNVYYKKKYKFQPFRDVNLNGSGLSYKMVMSVFEDSKGYIWFGTDGGGLNRFDPKTSTFKYYINNPLPDGSISGNTVKSIYEDSYGNLWFGTWANGLNLFVRERGKFIHFKNDPLNKSSLSNNDVWDITEDSKKNLWVATLNGGVNLLDKKTMTFKAFWHEPLVRNSICSNNIFSMIRDKQHEGLWIGTDSGLSYFNTEKQTFRNYFCEKNNPFGLSDDHIIVLYQDSKFNVWIGTRKGGLNLYHPQSDNFTSLSVTDGLISNSITGILEDDNHNLWISTTMGMSKFDPSKKTFSNYTVEDGLQGNEFIEGSAFKRKNGDLIFGGPDGFNIIHPQDAENSTYKPDVIISKLLILNKEVKPGEKGSPLRKVIAESSEITLTHLQYVVTFEFTALNYTNSEKNQYAYKLDGFDNEWNYIGTHRSATFTNLEHKTYVLRVKASNNDGVWNEKGASLIIRVLPPWWNTWWFKILVIIFFTITLISFYYIRMARIKRNNRILKKLVVERTKELEKSKKETEDKNNMLLEQSEIVREVNVLLEEKQQRVEEQAKELMDHEETLIAQCDELDQLNATKDKLFSILAHDLKGPFGTILGFSKLLLENIHKYPVKKIEFQLNIIKNSTESTYKLLENLLQWSRSQRGIIQYEPENFNFLELLEQDLQVMQQQALQKEIEIQVDVFGKVRQITADTNMLSTIVRNLVSNAIKFSFKKSNILIQVKYTETEMECSVKDHGLGIPDELKEKLFKISDDISRAGTSGEKGTGLGLLLCVDFVGRHKGKLWAESKKDEGSTFYFRLPVINNNIEIIENHFSNAENNALETSKKSYRKQKNKLSKKGDLPKLLIVEDNLDLMQYIKDSFKNSYQVIEAANGKEGLEAAKKEFPDIIISDIMMPEMDGLELCRHIKTEIETSHIPVILLTARSSIEHKLQGLETGADDYITKPFDEKELVVRIKNLIEIRNLLKEKFTKDIAFNPQEIETTSIDMLFMEKVMQTIEQNISNQAFDVNNLVSGFTMSRSIFHAKLKALTGYPPADFIRLLRLKRAARLIGQNAASISEICYMVGFLDLTHFGKCFKKQFGATPIEYRNSADNKNLPANQ